MIILAVDADECNGVSKGRLALRLRWSFVMAVFVTIVLLSAVVFQQGGRPFKNSVIRACFCVCVFFQRGRSLNRDGLLREKAVFHDEWSFVMMVISEAGLLTWSVF